MRYLKTLFFLSVMLFSLAPCAQETNFSTCYGSLCKDGEMTLKELSSIDEITVVANGDTYGIISFTVEFTMGNKKLECTGREGKLDARCIALRDKLMVGDQMVIEDVVFKDIKGGGKIRTAPELTITVIKPEYLED